MKLPPQLEIARTHATSAPGGLRRRILSVLTGSGLATLWRPFTRGAAVVFMLHRFEDPDRGVSGFKPDTLRSLLDLLRRRGSHFLDLPSVLLSLRGEGPPLRGGVVFTVDDGYREQATVAAPIFAEFDCPVTTFVTTGFLDRKLWFWWDQIGYVFAHAERPRVEVEIGGRLRPYDLAGPGAVQRAEADFTDRCKGIPDSDKREAIRSLATAADVELPDVPPPRYEPMSWDELRAAERLGMTFGPHTVTHPILSRTDDAQSRHEIDASWHRLRAEARGAIPVFAYPNGQPCDFGAREIRTMREIGLAGACVGVPGYATPRRYHTPDGAYQIPRFAFPDDPTSVAQFVTGLERLKRLLRGTE